VAALKWLLTSTEFRWDPDVGEIDPAAFDGVDVAFNVAGVAVAPLPWTDPAADRFCRRASARRAPWRRDWRSWPMVADPL
jgi:hypothetical protein